MISLAVAILVVAAAMRQAPPPGYVPERVYDTRRGAFSDFEVMLADVAAADVVLVGEQHDDPNTHRLEAAILEGLSRRRAAATVSLEMFERDVQGAVDAYLASRTDEPAFLAASRPWPRYATDYKPLVDLAIASRWPVVAANVPRKYASMVAKSGLSALDSLPPAERAHIAREIQCPLDGYFDRFAETMNSHPMPGADKQTDAERRATSERYYFAQCIKDETMAESIVRARDVWRGWMVVHYTGAFHSDHRLGTVERLERRMPGARIAVVSIVPVPDPANVDAAEAAGRGDYVVFVPAPAAPATARP
jgi:uncharacterized iron-regulated protein